MARISKPVLRTLLLIFLSLPAGCSSRPSVSPDQVEASLDGYQTHYEGGVRLRIPHGYEEWRKDFGNPETKCMLIARKVPAPFSEDFDKKSKSLERKTILSRKKVTIGGKSGVLLHTSEEGSGKSGPEVRFVWDLVFGDHAGTYRVSGVYYDNLPPLVSASLRAAVMSAEVDDSPPPKPDERQSFTIVSSENLKLVEKCYQYYCYTEDGDLPTKSVEAPLLNASNFPLKPLPAVDWQKFAEDHLKAEPGMDQFELKSVSPMTLDGLPGYELLADCIDQKSRKPIVLYYVVLFDASEYIMLSGSCGVETRDTWLPEFKAMANSIRRKPTAK